MYNFELTRIFHQLLTCKLTDGSKKCYLLSLLSFNQAMNKNVLHDSPACHQLVQSSFGEVCKRGK